MKNAVVIIPAYNPNEHLLALIKELKLNALSQIIIINDGSKEETLSIFEQAKQNGCTILVHSVNMGKGRALKTAFNYVLQSFPENTLAVCADADGQHLVPDIISCLKKLEQQPNSLVLGCRSFNDKRIPFRSRFGNKLTCRVFQLLCGVSVCDTQTGLRALSPALMRKFLTTKGERFEYEMHMLIDAKEMLIPISEVSISTIYIEENQSSHFNPLKDSFRIYSVFLKFILSSCTSSIFDLGIFTLAVALLQSRFNDVISITIATIISRLISSFINYTLNRKTVFNIPTKKAKTLFRYYFLCIIQLTCSALFVSLLHTVLPLHETFVKIIVDFILFIISFQIQREWVFRKEK